MKTQIYVSLDGNRTVGPDPWLDMPTDYMTEAEWLKANPPQEPVLPTLAEVSATKYAEIISGANAALSKAQAYYSAIEMGTWSEQETGAITIKGLDASVATKPEVVIMLNDAVAVQKSVERVNTIAENKGVTPEELADRILSNAQEAKELIARTLKQQNSYERQLVEFSTGKEGETENDLIRWIQEMVVDYSADDE